jgi:hypothetical protein
MIADKPPKSFEEEQVLLGKHTNTITRDLWAYLNNRVLSIDETIDQAGLNYIMTGVVVGLFAQYNASLVVDEIEPREYAETKALKNFNEWYKIALPNLIEQLNGKVKK